LVPRKLIRLSEGLEYLHAQFAELQQLKHWDPLHAARVVALQQLHPTLYRYVRQRAARYRRLFTIEPDHWAEPRYKGGQTLSSLQLQFDNRTSQLGEGHAQDTSAAAAVDQDTLREQLDLLRRVHQSAEQRGAGDPTAWFPRVDPSQAVDRHGLTMDGFADLYFGGVATAIEGIGRDAIDLFAAHPTLADVPDAVATDTAIAALLSPDAITRRELIEQHAMAGKALPTAAFHGIRERLKASACLPLPVTMDIEWLRDIAEVTSKDQLRDLYADGQIIEQWVAASKATS
jgi:hypothetical protein